MLVEHAGVMARVSGGIRGYIGCLLAVVLVAACEEPSGPERAREGATIEVELSGLAALDPRMEGSYHLWVIDDGGSLHWASSLDGTGDGRTTIQSPVENGRGVVLSLAPPGAAGPSPSDPWILRGEFRGGRAELRIHDAVTQGNLPLRDQPGQFTIFSPSTGPFHGYPHHEECGVWLFNTQPRQTPQNDMWVRLTPVRATWIYEHWVVRDLGSSSEIWLSGGKFRPSQMGVVNERDDTGWGPFSGVANYEVAGTEAFPGSDWYANPLGLPFPEELSLPLDLTEQTEAGTSRWHFVITIEPAFDLGEPLTGERPFIIRPYVEPFGTAGPGHPRSLRLNDRIPSGEARIL